MAEIKSTMDLVMERMAKMTAKSASATTSEDDEKIGMRAAAAFLDKKLDDLTAELAQHPAQAQQAIYSGAAKILLRNIVLPRDETLKERSTDALKGVMGLAQNLGVHAISQVCTELGQILDQYNQHKEQVTKQVEDSLLQQLEHQYASRGVDPSQLRPSMHPKYGEEMARMEQELNGQYNQAMDQRKEMILQQLGLA